MDDQQVLPSDSPRTIEGDVGVEAYQELLADFLGQLPMYLTDLNAAAAVSDVPAARYVAHQIKGNALSFGAVGLDELAQRLLAISKADGELLRPIVGDIEREVAHLRAVPVGGSPVTDVGAESYQQRLADFLGQLPLQIADLKTAESSGNIPAAKYVAHQLKSHAPGLSAAHLDGLADRLLRIRHDEDELLRLVVVEIEQEAARLEADLSVSTLESDVGSEVYKELLAEFLDHFPLYLSGLHNAAFMKDVPAARYVAHQIKGNALSFGAIKLDGLAGRLLRVGKDQSGLLQPLVGEIDIEVARLQAALGR